MGRISARLSEALTDGIYEIADEFSITKTEVISDAVRTYLNLHKEELPEHLTKDVTHEKIVSENRHRMRRLTFKSRVQEKLEEMLDKPFPPEPDKVKEEYIESLQRAIDQEYQKYSDEYSEFLDDRIRWYRLRHPECGRDEGDYQKLLNFGSYHLQQNDRHKAKEMVAKWQKSGKLPETKTTERVMNDIEQARENEAWKNQWDSAVRGEVND